MDDLAVHLTEQFRGHLMHEIVEFYGLLQERVPLEDKSFVGVVA